jgi:hypothetical protein
MKRFEIYWGKNQCSVFYLKSWAQAISIAKQYKDLKKITERN